MTVAFILLLATTYYGINNIDNTPTTILNDKHIVPHNEAIPKRKSKSYLVPMSEEKEREIWKFGKYLVWFSSDLSDEERLQYKKLLDVFLSAVQNLTYFLCDKSLLGSYRHHGLVPWDSTIEVTLPVLDWVKVMKILYSQGQPYRRVEPDTWYQLYTDDSNCHIDVFPYTIAGDSLIRFNGKHYLRTPTDMIFPLKQRPFWGRMVNSPRDPAKVLSNNFINSAVCLSQHKDEKEEKSSGTKGTNCEELMELYPFVYRVISDTGVNETLKVRDDIVGWWFYEY